MNGLPGAGASRLPFSRPANLTPARESSSATPVSPSSRSAATAAPFSALLGAILASNGATRAEGKLQAGSGTTAEGTTGANGGSTPEDFLALLNDGTSAADSASHPGAMSEAELQAAGLFATTMGAAGLAALSGRDMSRDSAAVNLVGEQNSEKMTGTATAKAAAAAPPVSNSAATAVESSATAISPASAAKLDTIAPELRERVERVVERMRDEFGIAVDVTEGYRTQSRQDMLHAQGRSQPGPVVTWTRNSRHTQGRAVDVMVNGGYSDTRGFATLQRVAREEGLHTLGMRDPGHLELPASVAGSARPTAAALAGGGTAGIDLAALTQLASEAGARVESLEVDADMAPTPTRSSSASAAVQPAAVQPQAGLARVAQVASVAQVATVARVARVAVPGARTSGRTGAVDQDGHARDGSVSRLAHSSTGTAPNANVVTTGTAGSEADGATTTRLATADPSTAAATPLGAAQAAVASGQASPRAHGRSAGDEQAAGTGVEVAGSADQSAFYGGDGLRDGGSQVATPRMASVTGANAADALSRIDQIDALRDGSASRPLSHLTLSLDNAVGGTDRIRVDVRGSQAGAVLELSDPVLRDRVSSNLGELQHALEQRGLQSDSLQVRRAGVGALEAQDMSSRIAGATLERESVRPGSNANPGQSSTQQRERDGRQSSDGPRDDPSSRHRPRREPKENHK